MGTVAIAVIGGGASGLAAAIAAAEELALHGGASSGGAVIVYEADERVGRSILATGNGRCNFSNASVPADVYRNAEFVARALGRLVEAQACGDDSRASGAKRSEGCGASERSFAPEVQIDPVHAFFAEHGLAWREEAQGRLYPAANKASSVLDVLRAAAARAGVREACNMRCTRIDAPRAAGGLFNLRFADGKVEHARAVIVCVGGRAIERLELPAGLAATTAQPVLGPLRTDNGLTRQLNNIRVKCELSLVRDGDCVARERGELLFRDYGVSGVCVFNLSRFVREGDELRVNLIPDVPAEGREVWLLGRFERLGAQCASLGAAASSADDLLRGLVLAPVAEALVRQLGLKPEAPLSRDDVAALAKLLGGLALSVKGTGDAKQCQVSRGGLAVGAFDPARMESRECPGLFACGEALDVDGPCGGYNLHWAWGSGILAGRAAARSVADVLRGVR